MRVTVHPSFLVDSVGLIEQTVLNHSFYIGVHVLFLHGDVFGTVLANVGRIICTNLLLYRAVLADVLVDRSRV
jgi:hypothetical protein